MTLASNSIATLSTGRRVPMTLVLSRRPRRAYAATLASFLSLRPSYFASMINPADSICVSRVISL